MLAHYVECRLQCDALGLCIYIIFFRKPDITVRDDTLAPFLDRMLKTQELTASGLGIAQLEQACRSPLAVTKASVRIAWLFVAWSAGRPDRCRRLSIGGSPMQSALAVKACSRLISSSAWERDLRHRLDAMTTLYNPTPTGGPHPSLRKPKTTSRIPNSGRSFRLPMPHRLSAHKRSCSAKGSGRRRLPRPRSRHCALIH